MGSYKLRVYYEWVLSTCATSVAEIDEMTDSARARATKEVKIVGGKPVQIQDVPYHVSLRRGSHLCGGTIVTDRFVVTAAHCAYGTPASLKVRVGTESISTGGKNYDVEQIFVHPKYVDQDYDVAVLKLKKSLNISKTVYPAAMVEEDLVIESGETVDVVGWGNTQEGGYLSETLLKVTVPVLSQQECSDAYQSIFSITPRMICAGVKTGGKDSCQGDSGGGLTYKGFLAGIVSFGLGCARPNYPGVYTRIAAVRPWIDMTIKNHRY